MATVTCYGGVGEIGGNIIAVESDEARILLDFGKNFGAENQYFSEFLQPRKAHGLEDFRALGLLPELDGVYRQDYLQHLGEEPREEPRYDALFLTHAHMDHIGYVHFLRTDIPIYCTPTTETMMRVVQETGSFSFDDFVAYKDAFRLREKSRSEELTRYDRDLKGRDDSVSGTRDIRTVEDGETVEVADIAVTARRVNHSLPGGAGFHIQAPDARLVYTGDLRLHGYRGHLTEAFIAASEAFTPDALITEGTNVGNEEDIPPEDAVRERLQAHIAEEDAAVCINHPQLDLERMRSAVRAAEADGRVFVVRPKQAEMLRQLEADGLLPWDDLSLDSDAIRVLAPQKGWGMLLHRFQAPDGTWRRLDELAVDEENAADLVGRDYRGWERDLVLRDDAVTPQDLRGNLEDYVVYMDYYRVKDLIDLRPEGGTFLWSRTEPFTEEMEIDLRRVHNWLDRFDLRMRKAHASGHMGQDDIAAMVETIAPDTLLAVHTERPDWFQRFAMDVPTVEEGVPLTVG